MNLTVIMMQGFDGPWVPLGTPAMLQRVTHSKFERFRITPDELEQITEARLIYSHQRDALLRLKEAHDVWLQAGELQNPSDARRRNFGMIQLPTGTGKSGIAVLAPYFLNVKHALVITPSIIITVQIHRDFSGAPGLGTKRTFLAKQGIFTPNDPQQFPVCTNTIIRATHDLRRMRTPSAPFDECLMVINAQKFVEGSRMALNTFDPDRWFDLVIVDEAHHYPANTWDRIIQHYDRSYIVFLTATPNRALIARASMHYDELTRAEAVRRRIIRDVCFKEVKTNDDAINKVLECLDDHDQQCGQLNTHRALFLVWRVDEAEEIAQRATELGLPTQTFVGSHPKIDIDDFKTQKSTLRALVVCGKLIEGFDANVVSVVCILRNVARSSEVLFNQFVGRSFRTRTPEDPVRAVVVSTEEYAQHANFKRLLGEEDNELPEDDPTDEEHVIEENMSDD